MSMSSSGKILFQRDFSDLLRYEGLFTLGSPGLHVRGCLEEPVGDDPQNRDFMRTPGNMADERFAEGRQKWGAYVPGIYGQHPLLNAQMVNLPWFAGMELWVEGERLDISASRVTDHVRKLLMDEAQLLRSLTWTTRSGARLGIDFRRVIRAGHDRLLVQQLSVSSDRPVEVLVISGIDTDTRTNGFDHLVKRELIEDGEVIGADVETDRGDIVEIRCSVDFLREVREVCEERVETQDRQIFLHQKFAVEPGKDLLLWKFSAVSTSRDPEDALRADDILRIAIDDLCASAMDDTRKHWRKRGDRCDVEIDGPEDDQLALRGALFHLLRAHPEDARLAIEPKGYAGDTCFGRFFWDTEMYLMPFFLYTDPPRARQLLEFRGRTLDGARRNAARYGYPGARFAWESDDRGDENCAAWQYADHEIHVTADIIYALAHYDANVPGDSLLRENAELLVETCRFWSARSDRRPGEDHRGLLGVMGPDEYAPLTDNNAYTNRMVKLALTLAAGDLGEQGAASEAERAEFAQLAEELPIPRGEARPELVLQCDGFEKLVEPRFDELWKDRSKAYAAQVSQERLYRGKNLKQADVLLMQWLFAHEFREEELRAAWDYYLPLTTHDGSLSAGIHAIVAARLGEVEKAYEFWRQACRIDLEGGAAQGIHIAGCAANWMMAVFGFAGLATAMETETLTLRPCLPKAWRRLKFPLTWRGQSVFIEITPDTVSLKNESTKPLSARVRDQDSIIDPHQTGEAAL